MKPKILIMDDEEDILRYMAVMFASDYVVLTSSNPLEALRILNNNPGVVAVIADKDSRKKGGEPQDLEEVGIRFLQSVAQADPAALRILMSGRTSQYPLPKNLVHTFWQKPFPLREAVAELGEMLVATAGGS